MVIYFSKRDKERKRSRSRERRRSRSGDRKRRRSRSRDRSRRSRSRERKKDRKDKDKNKLQEDEEEAAKPKRVPVSLEEVLAKRKAEEEAQSRVSNYSNSTWFPILKPHFSQAVITLSRNSQYVILQLVLYTNKLNSMFPNFCLWLMNFEIMIIVVAVTMSPKGSP